MNKRLLEASQKITAGAAVLAAFIEKFGDRIPDGLGFVCLGFGETPCLNLSTGYNPADRDKVLTLVGEVFGTDGWEAEMTYDREKYDWKRVICGVLVTINGAEKLPPIPDKIPVPPTKFPLQLADAN